MRAKAHANWAFIQNPFLNATRNSYRKFLLLCTSSRARLRQAASEPAIADLINTFEPSLLAFADTFAAWRSCRADYKAATARVEGYQLRLMGEIGRWDVRIQCLYYRDTPDYLSLLPRYRRPFQNGARDERINHLSALVKALADYPQLADVYSDVSAFYDEFLRLRDAQLQLERKLAGYSQKLGEAQEKAADALFRILGGLICQYGASQRVASFFDLSLIRQTSENETAVEEEEVLNEAEQEVVITADALFPYQLTGLFPGWDTDIRDEMLHSHQIDNPYLRPELFFAGADDAATQMLMTLFYEHWPENGDKREAFRQARQELRKEYPHPYYWGAFIMVGR